MRITSAAAIAVAGSVVLVGCSNDSGGQAVIDEANA
jgi:hypothetical protein